MLDRPLTIQGCTAPNRFVALPMEGNDAMANGAPSERTIERYSHLAGGGWGWIMIEAVAPDDHGRSRTAQLVLNSNTLPAFQKLIEAMRRQAPETIITIQINHAGRYALIPRIAYHDPTLDAWHKVTPETPVLTEAELDQVTESMARATALVAQTGAHGVDLKCCHGYLTAELMRPGNTRSDNYGGSFENRSRVLRAMLEAAAASSPGSEYLLGARISLFENYPGGLGDDENEDAPLCDDLSRLITMLQQGGAAWICQTAGNPYYNPELVRPPKNIESRFDTMALHHRLAARVKRQFPDLTVVGTGYTLFGEEFEATAEKNLGRGVVDAIGLGRQNFADPHTPRRLLNGDSGSVNWCRACPKNNCSNLLRNNMETGCVVHDEYYRQQMKTLKGREKRDG